MHTGRRPSGLCGAGTTWLTEALTLHHYRFRTEHRVTQSRVVRTYTGDFLVEIPIKCSMVFNNWIMPVTLYLNIKVCSVCPVSGSNHKTFFPPFIIEIKTHPGSVTVDPSMMMLL